MAKGIVRLVNFERGFGFIAPAQGCNGQVYFHCSTLKEEIFNFLEGICNCFTTADGPAYFSN